jgi:hypothetical protein
MSAQTRQVLADLRAPVAVTRQVVRLPDRLERATRATLLRNLERDAIDFDLFDAAKLRHREQLAFIVSQIAFIEAVSPRNLASLARSAPLPAVQAAFAAQIHDEIAHGRMLHAWLERADAPRDAHVASRLGAWAAERTQRDAWLGAKNAALLIEFYASALLDELVPRIDEPCLRSILEHIQKDEQRHKVIVVEAVRALREVGWDRRLVARALGPLVTAGTLAYFRRVFGHFLDERAPALAIPHGTILERALDESHTALARAMD